MPNEKNLNRLNALLDAFDNGAVQPEELIEAVFYSIKKTVYYIFHINYILFTEEMSHTII